MPDREREQERRQNSRGDVPAGEETRPDYRRRKTLGVAASFALLVLVFIGVIPKFVNYSDTWARVSQLGAWAWTEIAIAATVAQISAVWLYQAALPGLKFRHGFIEIETTSAISSTVPAGGAVAVGMTYKMFTSFGFTDVDISSAVVVTGIWNLTAKLALPVIAVALLALTAHPPHGAIEAAVAGVVVLIVAGVGLWLVFRSETTARWLGHLGDHGLNLVLSLFHRKETDRIERAVLEFRRQTIETVHDRGWFLTWTALMSQLITLGLVVIIVRSVGISSHQVGFAGVLTAFAVARLAGAVPLTPGGLGTIDAAFAGMLTAFGTNASHALAADLLWRLTTYLPPLVLGLISYLIWMSLEERRSVTALARAHVDDQETGTVGDAAL